MKRLISHSEISKAHDCQAAHAFAYTGHLTDGDTLRTRSPHARLRAGRAWGRGVAAFHQADAQLPLTVRYMVGMQAAYSSLDEDAAAMRDHGFYDEAEHHDMAIRIADVLWHYVGGTEPLTITDPEFELVVPIPSRTGRGLSNKYAFHGFLDGLAREDGRLWLAEYKMRDTLSDFESVARGRQYRRYVWAAERQLGVAIAGIIVDERLSIAPKPARWVQAKRKGEGIDGRVPSHAKDQLTTSVLYVEACHEAGVDINPDTVTALDSRKWQARHRVLLKRSEIEEAGRELVSAGQLIAQLDTGALWPVRNTVPRLCNGCSFKSICDRADDVELIDLNFDRKPPKRLREPLLEGSRS